jgi:hypothetical protein
MIKYFIAVIILFSGIKITNAQYLNIDDLTKLLDIAADDEEKTEVKNFLRINGFAFYNLEFTEDEDHEEGDTTSYQLDYIKKLPGDEYFIRVVGDSKNDIYTVMEFSSNEDRWHYYVDLLSRADLEPTKTWDKGKGAERFDFVTKDHMITLRKDPDDDGKMRYKFFISKL